MQNLKTFFCLIFLLAAAYACEPEEIPKDLSNSSTVEIDSGTNPDMEDNGDNEDETEGSHEEG